MEIEAIELRCVELDLVAELATSVGAERRRPVVLVRVLAAGGEGWGECAALAEPTYSCEHAAGARHVLLEHLLPRVVGALGGAKGGGPPALGAWSEGVPPVVSVALTAMAGVRGHKMAKAAVEMALLDAALREEGRSLATLLGAARSSIPAGATIGVADDPGGAVAAAARVVGAGYRRLKCKVSPGRDVAIVAAVRDAFPELALSADANGAYRFEEPTHLEALRELDRIGLVALEQPLGPDDLVGHARLAAQLDTPVLLDESVRSLGQLETAAALGACDGVVVKPGPLGGLLAARAVHDRCVGLGLELAIGGMLEAGIGRAASIAVGALPGFTLPGDLGGSARYFVPDVVEGRGHVVVDGELAVPSGAGLGVAIDGARLAAASSLAGALRVSS